MICVKSAMLFKSMYWSKYMFGVIHENIVQAGLCLSVIKQPCKRIVWPKILEKKKKKLN